MAKLKSGYTTGACAAAAAKAAVIYLFKQVHINKVEIPFPDTSRVLFQIAEYDRKITDNSAWAAVIKDAGDDPDVTNGARIEVEASIRTQETFSHQTQSSDSIQIKGGKGVGKITKRGLAVDVGEAAINPVPRKMIRNAVCEALNESGKDPQTPIIVTVSIVNGEYLAQKTLNKRLGIIGGLSILGTTGIVKPVSSKAWTDTITTSMNVAKAAGLDQIILSTGRTSEKAVEELLRLPEEALVMMGDYLNYSLVEAKRMSFTTINLAGMWAKMVKCAMEIPQTHVRNGALEVVNTIDFIQKCGADQKTIKALKGSNTAREIYERLVEMEQKEVIRNVCRKAKEYGERISGLKVTVYLVDSTVKVVEQV